MEAKKTSKSPTFKALRKSIKGFIKEKAISESTLADIKAACLSDSEITKETKTYLCDLLNKFTKKNKTEKVQRVVQIIEFIQGTSNPDQKQQESPEKVNSTDTNTSSGEEKVEKKADEKKTDEKKPDEKVEATEEKDKKLKKYKEKEGKCRDKCKSKDEKKEKFKGYKKYKKEKEEVHGYNVFEAKIEKEKESKSPEKHIEKQEFDVLDALFEDIPVKNCKHSRFALGDKPEFPQDVDFVFIDKPVADLNGQDLKNLEVEVCSFLNTRGGRIFFGINSDRVVVGDASPVAAFQKVALKIALLVVDGFYPALQPKQIKIDVLPVRNSESHHLLRIDVQKGEKLKLYCTQKGKYYYRKEGVLTKYAPQEVQEVIAANAIKLQKKAMKHNKKEEESEITSGSEEESVERHHKKGHWGKYFKELYGHGHKHHKHHFERHGHHHGQHHGHHHGQHHGDHHGHDKMHSPSYFGRFGGRFGEFGGHFGPQMMHPYGPHMMYPHSSPFHHHPHSYPRSETQPDSYPLGYPQYSPK